MAQSDSSKQEELNTLEKDLAQSLDSSQQRELETPKRELAQLDSSQLQELKALEKEGKQLAGEGNLKKSLEKFELARKICPSDKILRRIETLKTKISEMDELAAAGKSKKKKNSHKEKSTAEKKQSEELQLRLSELQKIVDDQRQEIIIKDGIIKDLNKTIEELKGKTITDVLTEECKKNGEKRKVEEKENGSDGSIIEVENNEDDAICDVNAKRPTKKKKTEISKVKAKTKKDILTDENTKSNKVPKLKSTPDSEDDQDLPEGWIRKDVVRKSGKTAGAIDTYFYSPDGTKLRSRPAVAAYLAQTKSNLDIEYFKFSSKKKITKSTNKEESIPAGKPKNASRSTKRK